MSPRLLVTGACGLLGAHVVAAARDRYEVFGIDRHPWWGEKPLQLMSGDLRDSEFSRTVWSDVRPDVVVHCAAMIDVDACERDPASAYLMNADVTGTLARLTGPSGTFVYVTTDSVFAGDRAMMTEGDLPCPRTVYARSKLHGEWNTQLSGAPAIVARTNVYGWSSGSKRTFGEWLAGALEAGIPITLFDDAFFTPTYVVHLADMLLALVEGGHRGLFHVTGSERVSKYDFGIQLATQAGWGTGAVTRGSIGAANQVATRPRDMSLSSARVQQLLARGPVDVQAGLDAFIRDRGRSPEARIAAFWREH